MAEILPDRPVLRKMRATYSLVLGSGAARIEGASCAAFSSPLAMIPCAVTHGTAAFPTHHHSQPHGCHWLKSLRLNGMRSKAHVIGTLKGFALSRSSRRDRRLNLTGAVACNCEKEGWCGWHWRPSKWAPCRSACPSTSPQPQRQRAG